MRSPTGRLSLPPAPAGVAVTVFIHEFEIVLPKRRYIGMPCSSAAPVELAATDGPRRVGAAAGVVGRNRFIAPANHAASRTLGFLGNRPGERRNKAIAPYDLAQRGPRNQSLVSVSHHKGAVQAPIPENTGRIQRTEVVGSRGCRAQSLYCAGQPCRIPYTWVSRQQTGRAAQ